MRRTVVQRLCVKKTTGSYGWAARLIALCACVGISACGSDVNPNAQGSGAAQPPDGTGFLVEADLQAVAAHRFTLPPAPVSAHLVLRGNGCVTVSIAGTQHLPIWPNGTEVTDSTTNPGNYTVSLSTGTTLDVNAAGGSTFEASGIVSDVGGAFNDAEGLPGKVQQLLDFCGAPGDPILFRDAATFIRM